MTVACAAPQPPHRRHRPGVAVLTVLAAIVLAGCTSAGGVPGASPSAGPSAAPSTGSIACPSSQPDPLPAGETRTVTISTALGTIMIRVEGALSPIAAGNFVALAACGFYDGVVFHRAAALQDGTPFVIQGGDPTGTGRGGPGYTITDEPVTGQYGRGTVAMARTAQPNSVGSQFFIVLDDKARDVLASYNTYQIVGTVTSGMETADAIFAAADAELPTNPVAMTDVSVANP